MPGHRQQQFAVAAGDSRNPRQPPKGVALRRNDPLDDRKLLPLNVLRNLGRVAGGPCPVALTVYGTRLQLQAFGRPRAVAVRRVLLPAGALVLARRLRGRGKEPQSSNAAPECAVVLVADVRLGVERPSGEAHYTSDFGAPSRCRLRLCDQLRERLAHVLAPG
jgi:hypothetical protein